MVTILDNSLSIVSDDAHTLERKAVMMENPCFLVEDPNSSWLYKIMNRNNAANAPTGVHNQNLQNNENNNKRNSIDCRLHSDAFICRVPTSTTNDGRYSEKREISIIYEPRSVATPAPKASPESESKLKKEWCPAGWRLELADHKHAPTGQKVATVFCALALATVITLLATAAVVYVLRTGVVMVNGEFRITNEVFRNTLTNHETLDFQHLSSKISSELDKLFSNSVLSEDYHSSVVTEFAAGLTVHCWLALRPTNQFMPGRVGMAFLGGLHHQHGNAWLGNYTVDIQSIGFESKVEEIAWSNWSDWSECKVLPGGRIVRVRTRNCVLQSGLHLSRADPCYLLDNHPSVDTIDCLTVHKNNSTSRMVEKYTTARPTLSPTSETRIYKKPTVSQSDMMRNFEKQNDVRANVLTTTTLSALLRDNKPTRGNSIPKATTEEPQQAARNYSSYEKRQCGLCVGGEVCVALKDDPVPYCRSIIDYNDPTGCGGHCKINVELCQRLQKDIYRCVDDSQCLEDEWQCSNRLCIPISKRCDGYFNCYDNTDEFDCKCNLKTNFHCGNLLSCLPNSKKCNGIVDCWDASDEFNCTKDCLSSGQFTCNDSQCIPSHQFCDGFPDCVDQSDEPQGCGGECKNNEWKCGNNRCIPKSDICNGFDNCGDNSDETSCSNVR